MENGMEVRTMSSAIVFPYSKSFYPVVKSKKLHYETLVLVSPKAWLQQNRRYIEPGWQLTTDFTSNLGQANVLIVADCQDRNIIYNVVLDKIKEFIAPQRLVICCMPLEMEDLKQIEYLMQQVGATFNYLCYDKYSVAKELGKDYRISEPEAVIVSLGNLLTEQESSSTVDAISCQLRKRGYRTATITSNYNLCLIGYIKFPDSIFQNDLCDEDKVFVFNQFIKEIDYLEKPDIILLQLPTGVIKYSNSLPNGFGIIPYLVSQAVSSDYFILCSPVGIGNAQFFERMSDGFYGRFGFSINTVVIQDVQLDPLSEEREDVQLFDVDDAVVDEFIDFIYASYEEQTPCIKYVGITDEIVGSTIADSIIKKLTDNINLV